MRQLRSARRRGAIPDTLLLVEHPPVITVGVQGDDGEPAPPEIPVVRVERGGKGTYHGPGQLVGYPIVDLEARGRDVRRFVHDVEEMVVRSLAPVGIRAGRVAGKRGVWVEGERKIASVGVAIEEWVSFHGFALNVANDLGPFRSFHPCGFDGRVMTSVSVELHRPVELGELHAPVLAAWEGVFGTPFVPTSASRPNPASVPATPT
jgi:lipoate-protein ligase B